MHTPTTLAPIGQNLVLAQQMLHPQLSFSCIAGAITLEAVNGVGSDVAALDAATTVDWNLHQKKRTRKNPGRRLITPWFVC
jgi:hypothetical protein